MKKVNKEEFIALWNRFGSASELAKYLDMSVRNVHLRRKRLEAKEDIVLLSTAKNSPNPFLKFSANNVRTNYSLKDGCIVVASDCHYWPGIISTAHRAFVKLIADIKPNMVIMNGDVFDGAGISRYPASNWQTLPSVKQELETCQERLEEIEKAAKGALLHWTWGNHDNRFNARLASQVGDSFKGIQGMNLTDHFAKWKFSTSIMVNNNTIIKHRYHNGIHAAYNNALKSGTSIVTGHLHSLKITPWTDYNGTRYGVDTGTLCDVNGDQFEYSEDNPKNHRSGFAVLTYCEGKLMPPELCEVVNEDEGLVYFRGSVIAV
jgi:hypothetical protein